MADLKRQRAPNFADLASAPPVFTEDGRRPLCFWVPVRAPHLFKRLDRQRVLMVFRRQASAWGVWYGYYCLRCGFEVGVQTLLREQLDAAIHDCAKAA